MRRFERPRIGERGATAVEYAIIAALIAVVIIAAVSLLGSNLAARYQIAANDVAAAGS
ncbi:MAG: Flp family type IVb pilin [Caulobacteraceae bacterium]